jgi:hypothetical protein
LLLLLQLLLFQLTSTLTLESFAHGGNCAAAAAAGAAVKELLLLLLVSWLS